MRNVLFRAVPALAIAALAACGGGESETGTAADSAAVDTAAATDGMAGIPGMAGMAMDSAGMAQMRGHMDSMMSGSGEQMQGMMAEHRQMAANMLAQMNRDMQGMTADAEWTETVEAIREDLARMPEMTPEEFRTFLPEHRARMDRLMEMHGSMMAGMQH